MIGDDSSAGACVIDVGCRVVDRDIGVGGVAAQHWERLCDKVGDGTEGRLCIDNDVSPKLLTTTGDGGSLSDH